MAVDARATPVDGDAPPGPRKCNVGQKDTMNSAISQRPHPSPAPATQRRGVAVLGLSALGIVFGDIGTSPLYTLKTVLNMTGSAPTPEVVLGSLSLIAWTLIVITSVKYVAFAMSIDNDG